MVIKSIDLSNGELYTISGGRRYKTATFLGNIEISEEQNLIPMLGTIQKGVKKIHAALILCGDLNYCFESALELINSSNTFEAIADTAERRIWFSGLKFYDSDPVKNEIKFEVTDLNLIEELLNG